ncbi:MAG: hypothetical protein M5U09_12565 [Gammaproteobacteria bacterium]|nr:hypothetical protein [Gammaproteobacteria bacterium]
MTYLAWHDPSTKRHAVTPFDRITRAIARYQRKYGRAPAVVLVHPGEGCEMQGIRIQPAAFVPSEYVYVGEIDAS